VTLTPEQAVDAANSVFGRHPGFRALHAKGVLCRGSFLPTAAAAGLTRAALYAGPEVPVTVRFSNGSGDPGDPDWAPDPRGMAIKFYLTDGSRTDIVAVSSPRFPTRTPEGFIELMQAQQTPWKLPLFFARHPEAVSVLPVVVPTLLAPSSYATIPYYGLHAFKWLDASGASRYVRYKLRPAARERRLAPWEARGRDRDYLQHELVDRLGGAPVVFALEVQIAADGDPVDDPSAAWPSERRRLTVGTVRVTGLDTDREQGDDVLVFDPTRVTDGIECSDDPVLRFRPRAYSVSVARRTGA
jgi:catalase